MDWVLVWRWDKYKGAYGVFIKLMLRFITACRFVFWGSGFKGKDGIPRMVKAYLDKKVMLDEFITHNMTVDQVNDAIELLKNGKR